MNIQLIEGKVAFFVTCERMRADMQWSCAYNHSSWLRLMTAYTAQSKWHGISKIKQIIKSGWVGTQPRITREMIITHYNWSKSDMCRRNSTYSSVNRKNIILQCHIWDCCTGNTFLGLSSMLVTSSVLYAHCCRCSDERWPIYSEQTWCNYLHSGAM